jgi:hypothetical protein
MMTQYRLLQPSWCRDLGVTEIKGWRDASFAPVLLLRVIGGERVGTIPRGFRNASGKGQQCQITANRKNELKNNSGIGTSRVRLRK